MRVSQPTRALTVSTALSSFWVGLLHNKCLFIADVMPVHSRRDDMLVLTAQRRYIQPFTQGWEMWARKHTAPGRSPDVSRHACGLSTSSLLWGSSVDSGKRQRTGLDRGHTFGA